MAGKDPSGVTDDVKQAWGKIDTEIFETLQER
eukprot:COSAG06_NODE_45_length_29559_cov_23.840835_16_plen_32_part_00